MTSVDNRVRNCSNSRWSISRYFFTVLKFRFNSLAIQRIDWWPSS